MAINIGGQLVPLKFSRDQESEADSLGVRYMTAAGYNPQAQVQVMQILQRESQGATAEILATHPLPATRIQRLQAELATPAYAKVVNDPRYGFYEAEFARRYLKRSAMIPAPTDSDFALANPTTWCEHCRAQSRATP
jgi:predicted Zn-dependent protease